MLSFQQIRTPFMAPSNFVCVCIETAPKKGVLQWGVSFLQEYFRTQNGLKSHSKVLL